MHEKCKLVAQYAFCFSYFHDTQSVKQESTVQAVCWTVIAMVLVIGLLGVLQDGVRTQAVVVKFVDQVVHSMRGSCPNPYSLTSENKDFAPSQNIHS